jgi:hypothetical protein
MSASSRRMKLVGHVAYMGTQNMHKNCLENIDLLRDLCADDTIILK